MVTDVSFENWLAALDLPQGTADRPSAVLTWLRGLFEAEGALDDDSLEIAYLLRQAELAGWAADLIRGDILRTTTSQATIEVVAGDSDNVTVTIAYNGGWNGVISSVDPQTSARGGRRYPAGRCRDGSLGRLAYVHTSWARRPPRGPGKQKPSGGVVSRITLSHASATSEFELTPATARRTKPLCLSRGPAWVFRPWG